MLVNQAICQIDEIMPQNAALAEEADADSHTSLAVREPASI